MKIKQAIEARIGAQALLRPTFYQNPGGLRFELSKGGSPVDQFLTAHRKTSEICSEVFKTVPRLVVCLSVQYWGEAAFAFRKGLRKLKHAGIHVPRTKEMWTTGESQDDVLLHTAFEADRGLLDNLLWCAVAVDLNVEPCPKFSVRLISTEKAVLVHPYDDRGMDVIGSNAQLLSERLQR